MGRNYSGGQHKQKGKENLTELLVSLEISQRQNLKEEKKKQPG